MFGSLGGVGTKLSMLSGELSIVGAQLGQRPKIGTSVGVSMGVVVW
jgi:hypothetical protein